MTNELIKIITANKLSKLKLQNMYLLIIYRGKFLYK